MLCWAKSRVRSIHAPFFLLNDFISFSLQEGFRRAAPSLYLSVALARPCNMEKLKMSRLPSIYSPWGTGKTRESRSCFSSKYWPLCLLGDWGKSHIFSLFVTCYGILFLDDPLFWNVLILTPTPSATLSTSNSLPFISPKEINFITWSLSAYIFFP